VRFFACAKATLQINVSSDAAGQNRAITQHGLHDLKEF
jgi:hypothetical protein